MARTHWWRKLDRFPYHKTLQRAAREVEMFDQMIENHEEAIRKLRDKAFILEKKYDAYVNQHWSKDECREAQRKAEIANQNDIMPSEQRLRKVG